MVTLASGSRVSQRYVRERVRGVTPAGVATPVDSVEAQADGGSAGLSKFIRASGSWIDDGFVEGQHVKAEGFADTNINATWEVSAVSATDLTVVDSGDVITDEVRNAHNISPLNPRKDLL